MFGSSNVPALAVLQSKDFRILWITKTIHELSRRIELLVLGYLILRLTDSPFQVGLVVAFLYAPWPALTLFAGVIADRLDRQRILVIAYIAYVGITTLILVLLITDAIRPWYIFLAIFIQGSANALHEPSRHTAIFDLAGEERIANAWSLETMTYTGGRILGPLTAGFLIAWAGFTGAYVVVLALDVIALLLILPLKLPHLPPGSGTQTPVWQSLREGIGYSLSNRMLLGVLSITLVANALVFPIEFFIPVIASELLFVGPILGGILGSAVSIGSLIGALAIAMTKNVRHHGQLFLAGILLLTVAMILLAWSPWFAISFILLLVGGVGEAGFGTMQGTILLLASAPEMRGRTMGALGMVIGGGHLLGAPEIGAIASAFGMALAIGVNAGTGIFLILLLAVLTPIVRQRAGTKAQDAARFEETFSK